MIHAYNNMYLNSVMHNLAALFDIAINAEELDADKFADMFSNSEIKKTLINRRRPKIRRRVGDDK